MINDKKSELIFGIAILVCLGVAGILAFCISNNIIDIETAKSFMIVPLIIGGLLCVYYLYFRNTHPIWVGVTLSIVTLVIPILILVGLVNTGLRNSNLLGVPFYLVAVLVLKHFELPITKFLVKIVDRFRI